MTRQCKACEGSGREEVCASPLKCPHCADLDACPACLGSGTVTDGPYRQDALVDAETLARVMAGWGGAVDLAMDAGEWAALRIEHGEPGGYNATVLAARAAFRAVPALRGE